MPRRFVMLISACLSPVVTADCCLLAAIVTAVGAVRYSVVGPVSDFFCRAAMHCIRTSAFYAFVITVCRPSHTHTRDFSVAGRHAIIIVSGQKSRRDSTEVSQSISTPAMRATNAI